MIFQFSTNMFHENALVQYKYVRGKMLSFDYVDNLYEDVAGLAKDTLFCPH